MKKQISLVLLLSTFTISYAQQNKSSNPKPISFGVKGGYNLSSMKFFDEKMDSKSFFFVGITGEQPISSKLSIEADLLYTQLGGKFSYQETALIGYEVINVGNTVFNYSLNQIQVPISLKYYFVENLSASVGMNFGFNISEKVKENNAILGTRKNNFENIKTLNLFPFLGAEYKITNHFFVDARYNFNFIKINKTPNGISSKIGFLQAGIGYRFK